jgi:hypothetical protein
VTVGTVGATTWRLKGLDVFARCSRLVPDARFVVVGPIESETVAADLRALGGDNLELVGRVSAAEMAGWLGPRDGVRAALGARELRPRARGGDGRGLRPRGDGGGVHAASGRRHGLLVEYGDAERGRAGHPVRVRPRDRVPTPASGSAGSIRSSGAPRRSSTASAVWWDGSRHDPVPLVRLLAGDRAGRADPPLGVRAPVLLGEPVGSRCASRR